tara:strand:- start:135 stop:611 length:477 start_codon:yes stop_codon:yes gene_type:complete
LHQHESRGDASSPLLFAGQNPSLSAFVVEVSVNANHSSHLFTKASDELFNGWLVRFPEVAKGELIVAVRPLSSMNRQEVVRVKFNPCDVAGWAVSPKAERVSAVLEAVVVRVFFPLWDNLATVSTDTEETTEGDLLKVQNLTKARDLQSVGKVRESAF